MSLRSFISTCLWVILGFPKKKSGHPIGLAPRSFIKKLNPLNKISFAQQGEDLVLERVLSRVVGINLYTKGNYVDIGAYHAEKDSVTNLLYLRGWNGIAIDPSSSAQKSFKKNRKRDIFYKCVIGEQDKVNKKFFVSKNAIGDSHTGNTLYPQDKKKYYQIDVFQRNINSVLDECFFEKIDFLNIDVEGAELEIIRKFDFEKFKPKIIAIEIHTKDIESVRESEIYQTLFKRKYICVASTVITWFFVRQELRILPKII